MKKADLRAALLSTFLTALLSISGTMALATAYDFNLNSWQVAGACLLFAAITCIAGRIRRGLWALPVLVLLCARQLWETDFLLHIEAVLWYISTMFDKAYDVGFVIWWTKSSHLHHDTTLFFLVIGILASMVTGLGLSKHRTWPGIVIGFLLLLPTMLITDLGPEPIWLLSLLAAVLCLFLTRLHHRNDPANAGKMTAKAMVCVVVMLSILTVCFHPARYTPPELPAVEGFLEHLQALRPSDPPSGTGNSTFTPDKVNLNSVGPKAFSYRSAFLVSSSEGGWLYLRDTSYTTYTGTSWLTSQSQEDFRVDRSFLQEQFQQVRIDSSSPQQNQLVPYYCPSLPLENGKLPNANKLSIYSYDYQPLLADWAERWRAGFGLETLPQQWDVSSVFLDLPDSTREAAQQILDGLELDNSMNTLDIAQTIGDYVRSSATYSLLTRRMPAGEEDFAIWFLNSSDTGYCVHFASAATVLLRAAGIPARYTVGYLAETEADVEQIVYYGNAHAWVEFYLPEFGWMILEVTPSSTEPQPTDPSTEPPTTSTEDPTEPPTTEPPVTEQPTAPTPPPTQMPTIPGIDPGPGIFTVPDWVWQLLKILLWVIAAVALVIAQWRLRLYWLMKRLNRGDPNRQALSRWRHTKWLSRLRKTAPPEQLLALANKARFSQHTLSHGELRQFDLYRAETISKLQQRNIFLQFIYRILLAIY